MTNPSEDDCGVQDGDVALPAALRAPDESSAAKSLTGKVSDFAPARSPRDRSLSKSQDETSPSRTRSSETSSAQSSSVTSLAKTPSKTSLASAASKPSPPDIANGSGARGPLLAADEAAAHAAVEGDPAPEPGVPRVQDSAYSWVVAGAAALQFVLVGGIHKSFGLMLAALVQTYGFSSAQVAIIPATYMATSFIMSPLCGALCRRLTERRVAVLGGICSMLGLALSGLSSDIVVLYFTNGLLFGIGQGFSNVPGTLMVTKYFEKRRGLANSITAASAAIGGVFFPLLVQLMLEEFGIPGTYLMLGGLHLHTLISASLYRPLETQRRIMRLEQRRRARSRPAVGASEARRLVNGAAPAAASDVTTYGTPATVVSSSLLKVSVSSEDVRRGAAAGPRRWSAVSADPNHLVAPAAGGAAAPLHSALRHRRASAAIDSSTAMLSQVSLVAEQQPAAGAPAAGCWATLLRYLDLRLLADPLYSVCVTSVFLFATGLPHVCLLVPRFGLEIGVSRGRTANMIATVAPIDIISRLSLGFLLDRNLFHKRYGLFGTCVAGGVGVLALVFVRSYAGLFAACTLVYAAVGFYFVVTPVMYAEYYGVEQLSSTLTISNMFSGVANLMAQPLCGLLRDSVGSFRPVFAVLSGCMLVAGGIVLLHPCVIGRRQRRQSTDDAAA